MSQIADLLPRAELFLKLYGTSQLKNLVIALYAHILKFPLRALRWYQESKTMRMIHAIKRPAELRYDDLLNKISSLSQSVAELALASSHAEQRDIHTKVDQYHSIQQSEQKSIQVSIEELTRLVLQMKESMNTEQVINASARIELSQILSEIQLAQFLGLVSVKSLSDPVKVLQMSLFMRNRRYQKPSNVGPPFWLDRRMQAWNSNKDSAVVMIKGTRRLRFHLRDFCADSVAMLQDSRIPVIWALKPIDTQYLSTDSSEREVSTIELLKYFVAQAIVINKTVHTDAALTSCLKAHFAATTEEDWFGILASVLQGIHLLYIIIDLEVLDQSLEELTLELFMASGISKNVFSALGAKSRNNDQSCNDKLCCPSLRDIE